VILAENELTFAAPPPPEDKYLTLGCVVLRDNRWGELKTNPLEDLQHILSMVTM